MAQESAGSKPLRQICIPAGHSSADYQATRWARLCVMLLPDVLSPPLDATVHLFSSASMECDLRTESASASAVFEVPLPGPGPSPLHQRERFTRAAIPIGMPCWHSSPAAARWAGRGRRQPSFVPAVTTRCNENALRRDWSDNLKTRTRIPAQYVCGTKARAGLAALTASAYRGFASRAPSAKAFNHERFGFLHKLSRRRRRCPLWHRPPIAP